MLSPVELFFANRNVARLSRDGIGSKQDFFQFDQVIIGSVTGSASHLSCFTTAVLSLVRTLVLKQPLLIIRKLHVCLVHTVSVILILAIFISKISMACLIKPDLQNATETHPNFSQTIFFALNNAEFGFILLTVVIVGVSSVVVAKVLSKPRPQIVAHQAGALNRENNRKATVMILTLPVVFVICNGTWCVFWITSMVNEGLETRSDSHSQATHIFGVFFYSFMITINSCANPVVYMIRNSRLNTYTKSLYIKLKGFITTITENASCKE